jgi:hypothetical protein
METAASFSPIRAMVLTDSVRYAWANREIGPRQRAAVYAISPGHQTFRKSTRAAWK